MKRKLSMIILTLTLALCSILGLTACGGNNENGNGDNPPHTHEFTALKFDTTNHWYECSCGAFETKENHKGGTSTETSKAVCSVCNQSYGTFLGHTHNHQTTITPPKCGEKGYTTYSCECGDSYISDYVSALTHVYTNYSYNNDAKCEVDGTETAICGNGCGTSDIRAKIGTALEHDFKDYIPDNNATYEEDGTKTATCSREGCNEKHTITDIGTKLESGIAFKTLSVNGTDVYGKVNNTTETFSFINEVVVTGTAKFVVSLDIYGMQPVATKTIPLTVGDNKVYVIEMIDGEPTDVYEVVVRRKPMYTVSFNSNGGANVQSQTIEEDGVAIAPVTTRTGYTFDKWDYNFNTPITSNKTITASWMANKNTPYKVEYYLENLEDDNYSLTQTISKTGTTDTTANAEITTFAHFTYKQSSTDSGNIAPNGSTVLKVYYTRDEYVVSQLDVNVGSVTNVGKYKYGTQITLTATEKPIGYSSFGWFNGDVLLSNKLIYNVTIDKDIAAKYIVKEEMSNFNFISTLTDCVITGIKDKTVTEIIVPNYVTSIDLGAFSGCFALEKIILPFVGAGEKGIEDEQYLFGYIFGNKSYDGGEEVWQHYAYNTIISYFIPISLQSVTILGNNIPKGSFSNCGMIKEVIISDTVKNINDYAFLQCDNLTSVKIPNSVINIGIRTFEGCSKLSSVIIGNSVTTIGNYAFSYCPKLTSVIIGNNVTAIGNYAFAGSKLLKHIDIPSSVTSMGGSSFTGCSSLESISIPFVGAKKDITINDYQYPLGYIFGQTEYDGSVVTEQTFRYSSGYTERTFYIPSSLKSVTITNDNVRYGAFSGCSNLTNISLLDSVCNIEGMAFYDCSSLTSITIPKDVTNIGYRAFDGCYKLVEVINKSPYINVEKGSDDNGCIGYYALSIFNSKDEYVNKFTTDSNGLVIYSDGINKILLGDVGKQVNITIPNDITEIHKYAFYNNRSLISLTIGKSVTNIGEYAFYNCHKLVEVINKSSYFTIEKSDYNNGYAGYYALSVSNCDDNYKSIIEINKNGFVICEYRFTNSHTLLLGYVGEETEIRLPGYIQIYKYALYDNDNITSVVIDRYTFGIGSCAFYDCDNLEAIGFTGYAVEWRNMSKATDWDYGFDGIKP